MRYLPVGGNKPKQTILNFCTHTHAHTPVTGETDCTDGSSPGGGVYCVQPCIERLVLSERAAFVCFCVCEWRGFVS